MTVVDRWILHGRDPQVPVPLLLFERLRWALIAWTLVLTLGMGVLLYVFQQEQHAVCEERNQRASASADALNKLAVAHKLDGNTHAAAQWREFQKANAANPLPTC